MMILDDSQKAVANWSPSDGNLRVVGGAGAGKTGTLAMLVAKLVLVDEVPPERICVTVYNKDAGAELRTRLEPLVGTENLERMSVGTFHSLGRRWMDREEPGMWNMSRCIDLPARSRATGVPSVRQLWQNAVVWGSMPGTGVKSLKVADTSDYHRREVSLLRAAGVTAADAPSSRYCRSLPQAWRMVADSKSRLDVWDFDDVLERWWQSLASRPEGWFDVVIVDEAQDNTRVRLNIAKSLAGRDGRIVLVGDLRQTIYVWAGAFPHLFQSADVEMEAQTLCLGYNYRSTPQIVDLSNRYASDKPWLLGEPPEADRDPGEEIEPPTQYATVLSMCDAWAVEVLSDEELNPGRSRAALFRTNGLAAVCEAAFQMRGIPVIIRGSKPILETTEGKAVLDYIRAIWQRDAKAMCRIVNQPNRYASRLFVSAMAKLTLEEEETWSEFIQRAVRRGRVASRTARGLRIFGRQLDRWAQMPWSEALPDIADTISAEWSDTGEAQETDNVAVLYAAFGLARRFPSASEFLRFTDPATRPERLKMKPVVLSTIHRAKGREWDVVFVDVTEGYLPYYRSREQEQYEEEQRLLYVAMTRAKTTLHFGCFEYDENPDISGGCSHLCAPLWADAPAAAVPVPDVDPNNGAEIDELPDSCDYDSQD
jgi:DNA helicase-2/ATP-dependent DNA helicase PcrA